MQIVVLLIARSWALLAKIAPYQNNSFGYVHVPEATIDVMV